jgi:hypothetical protein
MQEWNRQSEQHIVDITTNYVEFYGGRRKSSKFAVHTVRNTWIHSAATSLGKYQQFSPFEQNTLTMMTLAKNPSLA